MSSPHTSTGELLLPVMENSGQFGSGAPVPGGRVGGGLQQGHWVGLEGFGDGPAGGTVPQWPG